MSGGGAYARNPTLMEILGAAGSRYPKYKRKTFIKRDGGGDRDVGIGGIERVGSGRTEGGRIK